MIKNLITNTIPDICHFPGKSYKKKYSKHIFNYLQPITYKNIPNIDSLNILSIKSDNSKSVVEHQLENNKNFTCIKSIIDQKWKHIFKLHSLVKYIKDIKYKYILHLDAYDVVINNMRLENIVSALDSEKIIFNAENNFFNKLDDNICYKIKNLFDYKYNNIYYKYLNTGCFFGKKEIILEYLSRIIQEIKNPKSELYNISCDQTAIQLDYYLNQQTRDLIKLDTECKYFMCMNYLSSKDIQQII